MTTDATQIISDLLELERRAKTRRLELIRARMCRQTDPQLCEINAEIKALISELDAAIFEAATRMAQDGGGEITIPDLQKEVAGCEIYHGTLTKQTKDAISMLSEPRLRRILKKCGFKAVDADSRRVRYAYQAAQE